MRCKVEQDWQRDGIKVWFYEANETGSEVYRVVDGSQWTVEQVERGALLPEPSLTLRHEQAEALLRELSNVLPPSDATVEHLRDIRTVRDRLLAMIEKRGIR